MTVFKLFVKDIITPLLHHEKTNKRTTHYLRDTYPLRKQFAIAGFRRHATAFELLESQFKLFCQHLCRDLHRRGVLLLRWRQFLQLNVPVFGRAHEALHLSARPPRHRLHQHVVNLHRFDKIHHIHLSRGLGAATTAGATGTAAVRARRGGEGEGRGEAGARAARRLRQATFLRRRLTQIETHLFFLFGRFSCSHPCAA